MGKVKYFEEFNLQKNCEFCSSKHFGALVYVEMTFGLVKLMLASASLNGKLQK